MGQKKETVVKDQHKNISAKITALQVKENIFENFKIFFSSTNSGANSGEHLHMK